MAKTFTTMQTNIGNNVQDTSTALATKIGVWINDAYHDMAARYNWSSLIDDDYTFETVASTQTVSLPSDFHEEIFVADIANGHKLVRRTEGTWWNENATQYNADALDTGNPIEYVILREASTIKLFPTPDTAETYAMPYKKNVSDLSGTDTSSVPDMERFLEAYATGSALAYKRRLADADWWFNRAEFELRKRLGEERSRANQRYQFVPQVRHSTRITRLTGDASYDSL